MFNNKAIHNDGYEPQNYYRSTPKKSQSIVDKKSEFDQTNNGYDKLNEKLTTLIETSDSNKYELEYKILEIQGKLDESIADKESLKTSLLALRGEVESLKQQNKSLGPLAVEIASLSSENKKLSNYIQSLKKFYEESNKTKDSETANNIKEIQETLSAQIKNMTKTIETSYDKRSKRLEEMFGRISVKESPLNQRNSSHEDDDSMSESFSESSEDDVKEEGDASYSKPLGISEQPKLLFSTTEKATVNNINSLDSKPAAFNPLFGTNKTVVEPSKPEPSSSLIGTVSQIAAPSLFGTTTTKPSMFNAPTVASSSSPVGSIKPPTATSLFALNHKSAETESLQSSGTTLDKPTNSPGSIFGSQSLTKETVTEKAPSTLFASLSSSTTPASSNLFASLSSSTASASSNLFASLSSSTAPASSPFAFGNKSKESEQTTFGSGSNTLSFSSLAGSSSAVKGFGSATETKWASGSQMFGQTKAKDVSIKEEDDDHQNEAENEEHGQDFQPIIELPPLVELGRDDDQKDVLFKNRCKLYRYINNEWKERGIGDMKILRSTVDGSVTLLMRREQVLKICCNQRVSRDSHKMASMGNDKSACWSGADFDGNETTMEKFAIKFSDKSLMDEFTRVIAEAQKSM